MAVHSRSHTIIRTIINDVRLPGEEGVHVHDVDHAIAIDVHHTDHGNEVVLTLVGEYVILEEYNHSTTTDTISPIDSPDEVDTSSELLFLHPSSQPLCEPLDIYLHLFLSLCTYCPHSLHQFLVVQLPIPIAGALPTQPTDLVQR